jgi:ATP-dependent DNA ligase
MLLRSLCRARSRRDYDQLSALKRRLGLARDLWRSKELRDRARAPASIELNGDDLRRDPLEVRKATLASIVAKASQPRWGIRQLIPSGWRSG